MLALEDVVAVYGFSRVLQGVSLAVERGRIVALLGRNGAGKTATLRSVMGLVDVQSGRIGFDGVELRGMPTFEIAQRGIGYVPDDRRIFPELSVERNLALGARHSQRGGYWNLDTIYQLFPPLRAYRTRRGAVLSGGEQKMLAISRALMGNPKLLMLDEPSEGLSPLILSGLVEAIQKVGAEGMTILIADQNLKFARRLAQYAYIVENGIIRHHGTMQELMQDSETVRKYLAV
ncbi:MAG: ABC transporter ATP-binding protein [Bradyrhizobium sp.]|nr:ABC transporter ATP-binding protein [Bradyrhizobium sp.]